MTIPTLPSRYLKFCFLSCPILASKKTCFTYSDKDFVYTKNATSLSHYHSSTVHDEKQKVTNVAMFKNNVVMTLAFYHLAMLHN
jgi:hypothetical protein